MKDLLLSRLPVFSRDLDIYGYILEQRRFEDILHSEYIDKVTQSRIIEAGLDMTGEGRIARSEVAIIPITQYLLYSKFPGRLLTHNCAIQIDKSFNCNEKTINLLDYYSKLGLKIAYDGVSILFSQNMFIDIVDILEINKSEYDDEIIRFLSNKAHQMHKTLLVKNLDTFTDFSRYREQGFDLFQGFFLLKSDIVRGKEIPVSKLIILKTLSKLFEPNVDIKEISDLIKNDVVLSYKLLRLINSVYYARPYKVESILQALTLLGINKIRSWISMLLFSGVADKPHYLFLAALERAKMCELLGKNILPEKADSAFLTGLLSLIDAILEMPMQKVLCKLSLSDEINEALLRYNGMLGTILLSVISFQKGKMIDSMLGGFSPESMTNAFLETIDWSSKTSSMLTDN